VRKEEIALAAVRDCCVLANKPFEFEPIKPVRARSYLAINTTAVAYDRAAQRRRPMIAHSHRRSIFELATAAPQAFVKYGRHSVRLVVEALQRGYDTHLERSQMRLAPAKSRSWHDIPRAGAHHHYC